MDNEKVLLISHIDMDGSLGIIIMKNIYPNSDTMIVDYGFELDKNNHDKILEYNTIIMTDISTNNDFILELNNYVSNGIKKVMIFDHHDSAINRIKSLNLDWIVLDNSSCGGKIAYEYYKNKGYNLSQYDDLVRLVDDYDRWVHSDYKSTELQFLWSGLGRDKFVERFLSNSSTEFSDSEKSIINNSLNDLNDSCQLAIHNMSLETDKDGNKFLFVTKIGRFLSLVATRILKAHPEADYIAIVNQYGESISLRSTRYNVAKLAESLGGGGHELASGFSYDANQDILNSIINHEKVMMKYKISN